MTGKLLAKKVPGTVQGTSSLVPLFHIHNFLVKIRIIECIRQNNIFGSTQNRGRALNPILGFHSTQSYISLQNVIRHKCKKELSGLDFLQKFDRVVVIERMDLDAKNITGTMQ
jgi:hypothetical protein